VVGHLDTGYTEHPVFGDWASGGEWLNVAQGLNLREPGTPPRDPLDYEGNPGHGTRTASVLCGDAQPPVMEDGIASETGVAPRLPVVPCRVVNRVVLTPETTRFAVARGIRHCVENDCPVISISLGTPFFFPGKDGGLGRTVDRAYEAGIIIVAAAGQIIDSVTYPGKYRRTIGVAGVTWQRRIWFNYQAGGERIDVWAPADEVLRADSLAPEGFTGMNPVEGDDPGVFSMGSGSHDGKMSKGSGTSYATVHVAAAAAMWLRARGGEIDSRYREPWQRVEAFRLLLKKTAKPINGDRPANRTGVLDIPALLKASLPPATQLRRAPEDEGSFS
jgi:subtilisin family serine protease